MTTIRNILLLCFIAYAHGSAVRLTKEYDLAQEVAQRNPIQSLVGDTASFLQSPQTLEYLLKYPENFVNDLASLLNRNPNPQPEDIIDVLNSEFGTRLLVAQDDLVRVDSDSLNRLLTRGALNLAKQLYPDDYFKQWTAVATYKGNINLVTAQLKPLLQSTTLPLRRFSVEELTAAGRKIAKRDVASVIQLKDVLSDLTNALGTVCISLFNSVATLVNGLLTTVISLIEQLTSNLTLGIDLIDGITSTLSTIVLDTLKGVQSNLNDTMNTLGGNICYQVLGLTSSTSEARKRRDVENSTVLLRDTDFFTSIWSTLTSITQSGLILIVDLIIAQISNLSDSLIEILRNGLYSLINSLLGIE